ncbi:hypothetical protein KC332_g16424 [Hortaea werneckii]|uniref:Uncharacterized protein n=2 Tax=Hortaea werneckii TaxID=91943 RepID=A0A3M7J883_HORWE|nr:hypothetical protein KC350_g16338 [Hortaea werneckii]OTA38420.1 hypothetical protein BTJ68_01776 [Hortaea werneckii EXF-2000]KAI6799526.1 hypothetical protein KC358_g15901 [Hortaea werneckii]KAI6902929.1 hypothetical protein KC348_g15870 [Hortaea werneckii]KAI6920592.1 hypothetical protein KC341_g16518 [Hortaea werneckii]
MSDSNQKPHQRPVDEIATIDRQRFPSEIRSLLVQYMDQCDRMASLLTSLRDDVRDGRQESLNTIKKPGSNRDTSGSATHETPSDKETAVQDEAENTVNDTSAITESRVSSLGGGGSIEKGSGTQDLKKGPRSK